MQACHVSYSDFIDFFPILFVLDRREERLITCVKMFCQSPAKGKTRLPHRDSRKEMGAIRWIRIAGVQIVSPQRSHSVTLSY